MMMMMMMMAVIIICVIMLCFSNSAVQDNSVFYIFFTWRGRTLNSRIVKWWNNGDGCSGDSCASILALQEWIMRLSLSLSPSPLPLPFASGQNIAFPPVALWVTIGLAVCLLVLLIALAAVCRRKIKESCEEARREGKRGWKRRGGVEGKKEGERRLWNSTAVYVLTRGQLIGDNSLENPCLILKVR